MFNYPFGTKKWINWSRCNFNFRCASWHPRWEVAMAFSRFHVIFTTGRHSEPCACTVVKASCHHCYISLMINGFVYIFIWQSTKCHVTCKSRYLQQLEHLQCVFLISLWSHHSRKVKLLHWASEYVWSPWSTITTKIQGLWQGEQHTGRICSTCIWQQGLNFLFCWGHRPVQTHELRKASWLDKELIQCWNCFLTSPRCYRLARRWFCHRNHLTGQNWCSYW